MKRWISRLFNPALVAIATFLAISVRIDEPGPGPLKAALIGALFTGVLPTVYVGWLVWKGRVDGFFIKEARSRQVPLVVGALCCIVGLVVLIGMRAHPAFTALAASYAAVGTAAAAIAPRSKVSLHAAGIWGPMAALVWLFGAPGGLALPVAVGVCWARKAENAHSLTEIVAGAALAASLTTLAFYIMQAR